MFSLTYSYSFLLKYYIYHILGVKPSDSQLIFLFRNYCAVVGLDKYKSIIKELSEHHRHRRPQLQDKRLITARIVAVDLRSNNKSCHCILVSTTTTNQIASMTRILVYQSSWIHVISKSGLIRFGSESNPIGLHIQHSPKVRAQTLGRIRIGSVWVIGLHHRHTASAHHPPLRSISSSSTSLALYNGTLAPGLRATCEAPLSLPPTS